MSEPPVTSQDQLSRIRKLLEKAEANGVTPSEAEALRERAFTLAAKFEIDLAVARASGKPEKNDNIVSRTSEVGRPFTYQLVLANVVYQANGCKIVQLTGTENGKKLRSRIQVTGYRSDIDRADVLFTSLGLQAAQETVRGYRKYVDNFQPTTCDNCEGDEFREIYVDPEWSRCLNCRTEISTASIRKKPDRRSTWYRSFWNGWVATVAPRIKSAREKASAEAKSSSTGAEIALRSRDEEVEAVFLRMHPRLKRSIGSRGTTGSGFDAGREAGRRADVGYDRVGAKRNELGK